jgi:hypothetical protein
MPPKLSKSDLFITATAGLVGTLLVYVFLATTSLSWQLSMGGIELGCVCFAIWYLARRRQVKKYKGQWLLRETMLVDAQGSAEISFSPRKPIGNPMLLLRAYGKNTSQVVVEDIWINSRNVVAGPLTLDHWYQGITYPGVLNSIQDPSDNVVTTAPLKILVRNLGPSPVCVYAHVCATPTPAKD